MNQFSVIVSNFLYNFKTFDNLYQHPPSALKLQIEDDGRFFFSVES